MPTATDIVGFTIPGLFHSYAIPHVEVALRMAYEMKKLGDYNKALDLYERILDMDPRNARAYHAKGNIHSLLGQYEDAISCFYAALEYDPVNTDIQNSKAEIMDKMVRRVEKEVAVFYPEDITS
jgi:tetratricopeptide (TPR) repeat protein